MPSDEETVTVPAEDFRRLVMALEKIAQNWSRQLTSEDNRRKRAASNKRAGPVPDHVRAKYELGMKRRGKR